MSRKFHGELIDGREKATAITLRPHRACGALNDKNQLLTSTSAIGARPVHF